VTQRSRGRVENRESPFETVKVPMKFEVVVLAAGQSRRFGAANKLLAQVGSEPLVVGLVRRLTQVRDGERPCTVTVVTQTSNDELTQALQEAGLTDGIQIVPNARSLDGMGTSVAAGVANVPDDVDAVVVVPGDMPFVGAPLIEQLIAAFVADGGHRPVHPVLPDGTQTNPVVWPRAYFQRLTALDGDRGAKSLLVDANALTIQLAEPDAATDIDTPHDLARLTGRFV